MSRPKKNINPLQGERLRKERDKNGLSQQQLVIKTKGKIKQRNLSKYETNAVELPIYAAESLAAAFGVRPSYLRGIDNWRTWDDVPEEYYSSQINKAWDSTDAAEELLEKLGFVFEWTGNAKMIDKDYKGDEMPEYDRNDPSAYRLIVDGAEKGLCSSNQRASLIESIADYAEFEANKLLSKVKKGSADNG